RASSSGESPASTTSSRGAGRSAACADLHALYVRPSKSGHARASSRVTTRLRGGSPMKKAALTVPVLAPRASASVALACEADHAQNVKRVAATFAAGTVGQSQTRTCTTSDGKTIATTNATYTGTASGDPDLTGNVTFNVNSTINTTDGIGVV